MSLGHNKRNTEFREAPEGIRILNYIGGTRKKYGGMQGELILLDKSKLCWGQNVILCKGGQN